MVCIADAADLIAFKMKDKPAPSYGILHGLHMLVMSRMNPQIAASRVKRLAPVSSLAYLVLKQDSHTRRLKVTCTPSNFCMSSLSVMASPMPLAAPPVCSNPA